MRGRLVKRLVGVMMIAALALAAGSAFAGGGKHRDPEARAAYMKERALERLDDALDEIDADDKQREAIYKIALSLEPEFKQSHKLRHEARKAIKAELLKDKPDLQRVHDTVNTSSEQMTATAHKVADKALEAHAVLTVDQRKQLVDMYGQPRHKWDGDTTRLDVGLSFGLSKLNASDAQRKLAERHKVELVASGKQAHDQGLKVRAAIAAELLKDKPNVKLIHAQLDDLSVSMTGVAHQAVEAAGELWATATPEQRQLIREKAERKGRRR
jgi:Spy/CpxP family protein refolding chaperone